MAIPDLEVLLVIGIVAFYAQAAMMLLYHDELVFERVARSWRPSPGSSQWQGRFLFIPNLLAPWRPLFRGAAPAAPRSAECRVGKGYLRSSKPRWTRNTK